MGFGVVDEEGIRNVGGYYFTVFLIMLERGWALLNR